MKCFNCGNDLPEGVNFCENCGTFISLDEENTVESEMEDVYSSSEEVSEETADEAENNEEVSEMPRELEADKTEQIVPVAYEDEGVYQGYTNETEEEVSSENSSETQEDEEKDEEVSEEAALDSEEDAFSYVEEAEEAEEAEIIDENDDELDEMYLNNKSSKKSGVLIGVLVVILVCVIAGGVFILGDNFSLPAIVKPQETTTESSAVEKTTEKLTEEKTTEEESTEETTEEETTEEVTTEAETTTEEETSVKETEKETTEKETKVPTTKTPTTKVPTTKVPTTKVPTTKVPTTKVPTTKVPTTKVPTTKVPTTTEKYGITDEKVKAPSKYLSQAFTGYVKANGVILRAKPSSEAGRVLYLSVGADLKVMAEENGFYYVRSNRYGVYGWVSKSYVSKNRPEADTTVKVDNLISPDKKYSKVTTKYVVAAEGLRLRKGPGSSYNVIRVIGNGYPVKVIGYSSKVSGWVYVTDTTHGVSGWVSSAYIK